MIAAAQLVPGPVTVASILGAMLQTVDSVASSDAWAEDFKAHRDQLDRKDWLMLISAASVRRLEITRQVQP